MSISRVLASFLLGSAFLSGCNYMPTSGPTASQVAQDQGANSIAAAAIQVVDVDDTVARRLLSQRSQRLFSESLGGLPHTEAGIGPGDVLEVTIWEAPPATLFGPLASSDARGGSSSTSRSTTLPDQTVDSQGNISIPFAGKIQVKGRTISSIEAEIVKRLSGKANQPEVLVRQTRNLSSTVTVVGEVTNSVRLPLTPSGEHLLDALAAAGGVRQPVNKMMLQITRGNNFYSLPLDVIIRDPRQNIPLYPGDVITAMFQPLSFTALGATGKNEEINYEAQGITLAQALARAGGLLDARSDVQGVFIFRFEPLAALNWPHQPVSTTPDGLVPVVFRVNLRDPASFFVMQSFPINNKDVLYVSNSTAAELQKFLNLVFSVAYPLITGVQVTR